ncbi:MAG: cell wall-binding repeat-containing protein [Euzebya sp.]
MATTRTARVGLAASLLTATLLVAIALVPLPADAAFSGTNGEIFYGGGNVTAAALDGSTRVVSATDVFNIDVSPDGERVILMTFEFPTSRVQVVPVSGGTPETVAEVEAFGKPDISWSPDASRFVIADGERVTVYDADGSNPRVLLDRDTDSDLNAVEDVVWSTNGSVYTLAGGAVYRSDPDTAEREVFVHLMSHVTYTNRGIDSSPDGTELLVSCAERGDPTRPEPELCIHDADDYSLIRTIDTSDRGVLPEYAAFSPDGTRIAFNGADENDGFRHNLYTINTDGTGLVLLVSSSSVEQAVWAVESGTATTPPTEPPGEPTPTGGPLPPGGFDGDPATTERADFADPVDYAVAVSVARFDDAGGTRAAEHVVVSRDDAFADSLVGAALTGNAPLLFTQTNALPPATAAEIDRVLGDGGRVYLLGGIAAVSAEVATQLSMTHEVVRLEGPSRVETSVRVAQEVLALGTDSGVVAVARADSPADNPTAAWADSVSAGAWTAAEQVPTVVTQTVGVHPAVAAFLAEVEPDWTFLLGGEAALSRAVYDGVPNPARFAGSNRAETAQVIDEFLIPDTANRRLVVINGYRPDGWLFGLPAGGLAADAGAAIALAQDPLPPETAEMACDPDTVDVLLAGAATILTSTTAEALEATGACPPPDTE